MEGTEFHKEGENKWDFCLKKWKTCEKAEVLSGLHVDNVDNSVENMWFKCSF